MSQRDNQPTLLALPDGQGINVSRVVSWQDQPARNGSPASLTLTFDCGAVQTSPPGSFVPYTETYTGAARDALLTYFAACAMPLPR
jgi:hypothetical protein